MIEWISDRLWNIADWLTAAAVACKKASIAVLVFRLRMARRR